MITIIKVLKRIVNKITGRLSLSKENEVERVRVLKDNKKSDKNRWEKNEQLLKDWDERTTLMASYLGENASIIEFGAGNMYLKSILKSNQKYTPSDIIQRFPDTLVCDLNQPLTINLKDYDTAMFSGVLEYVYDVETVFAQLNEADVTYVIVSYCCSDKISLSREKNGWLSDYTKLEIEAIFRRNDYIIKDYQEWRSQSIFNLSKQN